MAGLPDRPIAPRSLTLILGQRLARDYGGQLYIAVAMFGIALF